MARDTALFSIGFLPFILIAAAFTSMASILLFTNLTANDVTEILIAMGAIWLTVISIMFFVSRVCGRISPREGFSNEEKEAAKNPIELFTESFLDTEKQVCELVVRNDTFIKSNLGAKGNDDPSLVIDAQNNARGNIPMVVCPPLPLGDPDNIEDRLTRMEKTLNKFTGVQLKKTYDKIFDTSECFKNQEETFIEWLNRLKAIQDTLNSQKGQYLIPIDEKQKELKSGQASDCDKQKGADDSANSDSLKSVTSV
jgi:hypothetical protein